MRGMKLFSLLLLGLPLATTAADLAPATNRIEAVTVFLDRAEVTRTLSLQLPAGENTLLVEGLPAQLIEASLKAAGKGPKGLRIGALESRRHFGEKVAQEEERRLRDTLQALQDEQAQLNGKQKALDAQAAFIERLATLPSEQDANGNRLFTPEKWPTAWQAIGKGMAETNAARTTLTQQQRELKERISKVEQELRQVQTGRRDTLTAALHLQAATAGRAEFTLSYQVPGASWSPLYDASLDTEAATIELTQAAHVRQGTGESWDGVTLTLSTARPSAGAAMPELDPWWIDFERPIAMPRAAMKSQMADEMLASAMAPEPAREAETITAEAVASEFSLSYQVPGRVNVPADSSRHRFTLAKQSLKANLSARTAPKYDSRAILYASLDYPGENPLLAGPWQLQRDGVYVGNSRLDAIRHGEPIALPFGSDDAIVVDYKLVKNESGKQGILQREKSLERQYLTTITNRHRRPITVTLYEQLPVARNEAIKVELDDDGTPPDERNVEGKTGVIAWKLPLKAGEKREVKFGYLVSYPKDRNVPGL